MKKVYVEIINGNITKVVEAGSSYKNTSFGTNATPEEYKGFGLYEFVKEEPISKTEHQKYNGTYIEIDEVKKVVTEKISVVDMTQVEIDTYENDKALTLLRELDLESIRAIREYIASKPDAPQILKDKEAAAAAERAKLRP